MSKSRAEQIFEQASSFHHASTIILLYAEKDMLNPKVDKFISPAQPYGVCLTFSVELYIKSLLETEGCYERGHKLNTLFSKLPQHVQDVIIKHEPDIISVLDVTAEYFEKWRYSFDEKNSLELDGPKLERATSALISAIRELHPEWPPSIGGITKEHS